MRTSKNFIVTLVIITVMASPVLLTFRRHRSSEDVRLFYTAKRNGYYGLYEGVGRSEKRIFDSGDILEAYPDLARYQLSYDVSEDGRYVAYSAVNVLGDADIFLYDSQNGQTLNLTSDTHTDTYPVFSHGGQYIAYLSHEKSGRRYDEIFLVDFEGSGRIRLTNLLLRISSLTFSPDDGHILFAKHLGDRSSIVSLDIESGEIRELTKFLCLNVSPVYDSRGERIVYISDCHGSLDVWIMNGDGTQKRPLYKGAGEERDPHFIAGDESVVFISVSADSESGSPVDFSLLSVDLDGEHVRNLLPEKYRRRQIFIAQLDMLYAQNLLYFQGKFLDGRGNGRYKVFTMDFEKRSMSRTGIGDTDMLDPVFR
jgi:WD40 repeat protein